jgi:general secretion pathway protein A
VGLDREETEKYIAFRLQKAGGRPDLFTPHAADMIFKLSEGIPRSINLACEAALVYGFADEAQMISQDIVKQIIQDKIGVGLGNGSGNEGGNGNAPPAAEASEGVLLRLQNMESEMRGLRKQIASQTKDLQQTAAGNKEELVVRLNQLLQEERNRNAELVRRYSRLEIKYQALMQIKTKLEKKLAATQGEIIPRTRSGG